MIEQYKIDMKKIIRFLENKYRKYKLAQDPLYKLVDTEKVYKRSRLYRVRVEGILVYKKFTNREEALRWAERKFCDGQRLSIELSKSNTK